MSKFLTFLLIITSITVSYSQSQTVTSLSDNCLGSLRAVVDSANAGDTIRFDPNLLSSGEHDTIFLSSEILINKSLYFEGLDHDTAKIFVSGNSATRIFRVDISSLLHTSISFTDYFFTDAYASSGSGNGGVLLIEQLDTLKLNNCQFKNCEASGKGGAI